MSNIPNIDFKIAEHIVTQLEDKFGLTHYDTNDIDMIEMSPVKLDDRKTLHISIIVEADRGVVMVSRDKSIRGDLGNQVDYYQDYREVSISNPNMMGEIFEYVGKDFKDK